MKGLFEALLFCFIFPSLFSRELLLCINRMVDDHILSRFKRRKEVN